MLGTVTYGYDSDWGDKLVSYGGQPVVSDEIGNMLSGRGNTYTWEHGRELETLTKGTTTWTYSYDAGGMRTSRGSSTKTYNYVYNGSKLTQMTVGNYTLNFAYDAAGVPMTLTFNGTTYYYVTNLQGDVVSILNANGTEVVHYTYDAWGAPQSTTGTMAGSIGHYNPLRYRGYVYDRETSLYYLQSRYYDPQIGRFISADAFVSTGQGLLGNNMFAYCGNNPLNLTDEDGEMPQAVIDKIIHNKVLERICAQNTDLAWKKTCVYIDVKTVNGKKVRVWGFCDLYNTKTGEVWELKKNSTSFSCTTQAALAQLGMYINGYLKENPDLELKWPTITLIPQGYLSVIIGGYTYSVFYWSEGNGILRYTYTRYRNEKENIAKVPVPLPQLMITGIICAISSYAVGHKHWNITDMRLK